MINFETATREELLAYIEQQKLNKKTNKLDKLLTDLQKLFNEYSDNSTDKLLWLYFLLSVKYSSLSLPINELLEQLDYEPEEEDITKLFINQVKLLSKTDDFKLRKSKKNRDVSVNEILTEVDNTTPL